MQQLFAVTRQRCEALSVAGVFGDLHLSEGEYPKGTLSASFRTNLYNDLTYACRYRCHI